MLTKIFTQKAVMPTQTAYAVYSAKEKAKSSVSDFKRGMVQEQQSRQTGRLEKQEQRRQNIADKRMELQKAQEARQAQRKADGSATTGATRPHERPATASTIPKPSAEKMQEVKRPATATTSKISEPVKANVIKERPLSSGASDRKATQPAQPVHRQNVEKVVSQETRQNDTKDRRTKVQQTQTVQKNQQTKISKSILGINVLHQKNIFISLRKRQRQNYNKRVVEMLHKIVICIITALLLSVYFQNCKCN